MRDDILTPIKRKKRSQSGRDRKLITHFRPIRFSFSARSMYRKIFIAYSPRRKIYRSCLRVPVHDSNSIKQSCNEQAERKFIPYPYRRTSIYRLYPTIVLHSTNYLRYFRHGKDVTKIKKRVTRQLKFKLTPGNDLALTLQRNTFNLLFNFRTKIKSSLLLPYFF